MELIGPDKIRNLVIRSIEFDVELKEHFLASFSYEDDLTIAIIIKSTYYMTVSGKLENFIKIVYESKGYFFPALTKEKLEEKVKELSNVFMRQFNGNEVTTNEKIDIGKNIASAINSSAYGWY